MKIFLAIAAALVGLIILSVGVFLWSASRRHGEVGDVAHSLGRDFPAGISISSLPDRALNLAASGLTLYSSAEPSEVLASADRSFQNLKPDDAETKARFESDYEKFKKTLGETRTGTVVVAFPVVMNARWVLSVKFDDGKVINTETRYLD